jgi:uncharacterized membrane protein
MKIWNCMDFFYSVLDCFILEGSCYQLLKSILKVVYHFIGIYNIVSVIHHNTQQSVMDRVKIIIQRHKNNYFKNWSTQELTFPQYLLQYLLQYYTQVKNYFFKSQYWYNNGIQYWNNCAQYWYKNLWSPSTGDPSYAQRNI